MRLGISIILATFSSIFLIIHIICNIQNALSIFGIGIIWLNRPLYYITNIINFLIGFCIIAYIFLRSTILKNKIYKLPFFAFYAIPIIYFLILCFSDMIKFSMLKFSLIDINAIFGLISVLLLLAADLLFNKVQIKLPPTKADRIAELEKQVEELKAKSDDK